MSDDKIRENISTIYTGIIAGIITAIIWEYWKNSIYSKVVIILIFICVYLIVQYITKIIYFLIASNRLGIVRIFKNEADCLPVIFPYFKKAHKVDILMIRGDDMPVTKDTIKSSDGSQKEIRVLLQDPFSQYIEERAKEIGETIDHYKDGCRITAEKISNFKERFPHLKDTYYQAKYFWKLILMDRKGFFTYYSMKEPYVYEIRDGPGTLHEAFAKLFDQMWDEKPGKNFMGIVRSFEKREYSEHILASYFKSAKNVRILAIRGHHIISGAWKSLKAGNAP